jgi:exopolysaccharide production protein ExoZ
MAGPVAADSLRIRNLQALRAVAALMIVAVHLSGPDGAMHKYAGADPLWWLHAGGQAGVDLFFVISGVIMVVTTWRDFGRDGAPRSFLLRRVARIYPLYWVVTLPILVVFLIRPDLVNSSAVAKPQIIPSFLLLPQPGYPLLIVGWTLVYEMLFYGIFALALLLRLRWLAWILLAWSAFVVALQLAFGDATNPWLVVLANPMNLEFALGVAVGWLIIGERFVAPRSLLVAGAAVVAVLIAVAADRDGGTIGPWFRLLGFGVALAAIVYAAVGLEARRRVEAPRALQTLGDASYSLYLIHVPVITVLGRAISGRVPDSTPVQLAVLAGFAVAVVIASLVMFRLIERPLLRAVRARLRPLTQRRAAPNARPGYETT